MVINIKILKRYSIDKIKFQMKKKKRCHTEIKSINHKINNIFNNKVFSLLLYLLLLIFFPSLSKEINVLILSNEIIIKIKGTGDQAILDSRVQIPSQIYLNNESQSDMYTVYNLSKEINEIRIVWDSPINSCNNMFYDFINIIEADLSKFDASKVTSMSNMFKGCSSLISINLNISNTSSLTDLSDMFYQCTSLEELDLSFIDTSSVTTMYQMLFNCISLISLNLENFNSSSVTDFQQAFFGLQSLTSLDLSHLDTSSATTMFQMFLNCYKLKYLDISNFETYNVENMHQMFYSCRALTSLNLSNFDTSKVTIMNDIFYDCNSLEYLDLSINFNTSKLENMENMFSSCYSLKSLDLSSFDTSSVSNMGKMFRECQSLEYLDISNFNTSKVLSMNEMFFNCKSLKSLELGNLDLSLVTDMGKFLYNCHSLLSLNLFNFNPKQITNYNEFLYNVSESFLYCIGENNLLDSQINNDKKVNCSELCSSINNRKYIVEKNKCISDCSKDNKYIFEYNYICYSSCPNDSYIYDNYTCKKAIICKNYYNYNHTGCLDSIPLGFYLNDTVEKTIDKCNIKCDNCTLESMEKDLCISCNINENYYSKFNVSMNINSFINCYNQLQTGYYLDNTSLIFYPCHYTCEECSGPENNQCIKCLDNYILQNGSCIDIEQKDSNIYNYETHNTALTEDKNDDTIFTNNKLTSDIISNEYNSDTTSYFNGKTITISLISDTIKYELLNEDTNNLGIISDINNIHELNRSTYSYNINTSLIKLYTIFKNRTFIDLSQEVKEFIYNKFKLDKEKDKIYVLIDEFISEDPRMVTYYYNYRIFLENGTELNLGLIDEDIYVDIYTMIKDKNLVNFNYTKYFYKQGYDIYDKNSEFYNDFCTPAFVNENDIILEDRKKYIYPNNVTLCKNNCKYKKVDLEEERIICLCNINSIKNISNEENDFLNEDDGNFISYLLDNINYKIFKCYKVINSFDNLKSNLAFYALLLVFLSIAILNLIFLLYSLPRIIKMMYRDAPTPAKVKRELILELKRLRKLEKNAPSNPRKKKKSLSMIISKKIKSKKSLKKSTKNNVATNSIKDILLNPSSEESILKSSKISIDNGRIKREELNDLPYTLALNLDKRNVFQIFLSLIIQKLEIINLFISDEKVKLMIICEYILSLQFNFFFNALLYSDEVISNKYHNNGELDFVITLTLSISSNIISSIVCYYVNYSKGLDERYDLIMTIKSQYYYLKNIIIFFKYLKIKFIYFAICELLIICTSFYYVVIFFIIYSKSIGSLILNYFTSLFESFLTSIVITIIIVSTRKIGLTFLCKELYNTSKYINNYY